MLILREIVRIGLYMYDGCFGMLCEVVDYYNKGGFENFYLDEEIFFLELIEEELEDLVKFF